MKIRGFISGNPFRFPIMALLVLFIAVGSFTFGINRDIATAATLSQGTLLTGTGDETPYYIIDSGVAGTTLMLFGGTHGNEPAGYNAVNLARNFSLTKGKLIIIPSLCIDNINNNRRDYPVGHRLYCAEHEGDPNRYFPEPNKTPAQTFTVNYSHTDLGVEVVNFILQNNPQWVVDLHESLEYRNFNTNYLGQSIIIYSYNGDGDLALGDAIVTLLNKDIDDIDQIPEEEYSYKSFVRLTGSAEGSIARAVNHVWDSTHPDNKVALIAETAQNTYESGITDPPLAERIMYQLRVIKHSLYTAKMITTKPTTTISTVTKVGRAITVKYSAKSGLAPFYYYVECKRNSGSWVKIYSGTNLQYTYTAPSTGTYYFRVKARANDTATFGTGYGATSTVKSIVISS